MKKRFFDPEAEVIELLVKDIVTISGGQGADKGEFGEDGNEPEIEFGL